MTEIRFQIIHTDDQGKQTRAVAGYILDADKVLPVLQTNAPLVKQLLSNAGDTDKLHIGRKIDGTASPNVITIEKANGAKTEVALPSVAGAPQS